MNLEQCCVEAFHDRMSVSPKVVFPSNKNEQCLKAAEILKNVSNALQSVISVDARLLRLHLMIEELSEVADALGQCDELKAFDGVCDLLYVTLGTAVTYDWPADLGFAEVHASNMTKEKQPDDPHAARVRQKGPNYRPPNLKFVLEQWRKRSQQESALERLLESFKSNHERNYIYVGHLDDDKLKAVKAML